MAWQKRGENNYYYRSSREGGRPTKEYFGRGAQAELAAQSDAARRAERQAQVEAERDYQKSVRKDRRFLDSFFHRAGLLIDASFVLAGLYRHDRGPWRRRKPRA
jgi:hypothetical protein